MPSWLNAYSPRQVKRTLPDKILLMNWLFKKRIRVVPVPVVKFKPWVLKMSCEYFTRASLICIWSNWKSLNGLNLLDDIYTTIQGNWAGRNFVTASRVNSWLITHARTWQRWIWSWNLQLPKDDINFRILINSLMVSIRNPSAYGFGNAHVSSGKLCAAVAKIWLFGPHIASPQTSFGVRLSRIHNECVTNEHQRTSAGRLGITAYVLWSHQNFLLLLDLLHLESLVLLRN